MLQSKWFIWWRFGFLAFLAILHGELAILAGMFDLQTLEFTLLTVAVIISVLAVASVVSPRRNYDVVVVKGDPTANPHDGSRWRFAKIRTSGGDGPSPVGFVQYYEHPAQNGEFGVRIGPHDTTIVVMNRRKARFAGMQVRPPQEVV